MFIEKDISGDMDGIGSEIKNLIVFNALGIAKNTHFLALGANLSRL